VEGEDNNGDMCRKPQEKSCMTSSSFNVRILSEFIWWAATAILLWLLIILFDVDAQFHELFFYPRIILSSLLLRVDCLTNIEVKAQEGI
jgi:hypothetical protein